MILTRAKVALVLELIGRVAVDWNNLESRLWRIAQLYLDTDMVTTQLLLEPMRASDISNLVLKLAKAKELNHVVKDEIIWWIGVINKCRENRKKILHRVGNELEADGKLEVYLVDFCADLVNIKSYGESLFNEIEAMFYDASSRPTPDGEYSGPEEFLPLRPFNPPPRPNSPKTLN
ncbi:MAG: hypothetical protein CFE32_13805 [Alphaproteobacteria bacterium PA3]|nr:MAG: hypothetical protein CFE32_13805 [Alphaproteobacteria bacterium PA3]